MYIILSLSLGEITSIITRQIVLEMIAAGFEPSESSMVDKHLDISLSLLKEPTIPQSYLFPYKLEVSGFQTYLGAICGSHNTGSPFLLRHFWVPQIALVIFTRNSYLQAGIAVTIIIRMAQSL